MEKEAREGDGKASLEAITDGVDVEGGGGGAAEAEEGAGSVDVRTGVSSGVNKDVEGLPEFKGGGGGNGGDSAAFDDGGASALQQQQLRVREAGIQENLRIYEERISIHPQKSFEKPNHLCQAPHQPHPSQSALLWR